MLLGGEGGLTQRALVDLLREVGHLMQFENVVVPERFAADIATVRFFFGVSSVVNLQLFAAAEPLVADRADVGSLSSVRPHVDHKLPALDKSFPAELTLVRPLTSVDPQVAVQLPGMFKASLTEGARKLFSSLTSRHFGQRLMMTGGGGGGGG